MYVSINLYCHQVHLLTAHIDDLTAEVSAPLDRLVDIALQASRTDGMAKQHLLKQFENKASFLTDQLEVVNTLFKEATDSLQVREESLEKVDFSLAFLKKLTPHAVGAARSLASKIRNSSNPTPEIHTPQGLY